MQCAQSSQLDFVTNGDVFLQKEWLEFRPNSSSSLPKGQLLLATLHDVGFLRTDSYRDIRALRARAGTTTMSLFSDDRTTLIRSFGSLHDAFSELAIRPGDIVPGHNCHGFTFAFSEYWIDNDQIDSILTDDGYRETDQLRAHVLVFRSQGDIVHSALVDRSQGLIIGKAGVRGHIVTASISDAAQGIPFDSSVFYRRDGLTSESSEPPPAVSVARPLDL